MKSRKHIAWMIFFLLPVSVIAKDYHVSLTQVADVLKASAPGDRILIKDGTVTDVALRWRVHATEGNPVVVEAEHPGKVIITGASSLQLSGSYLQIKGLLFKDGTATRRSVVEFGLENEYAFHCRLTDCMIDNFNTSRRDESKSYVFLSGRYNRVDRCSFLHKYNLGVTLLVNLNGKDCLENHHQIDHNYFGPRGVYASNGAETMRVGTSQQSYESSRTVIENNLFDQCSGEVEVISIKSCDNIIRNNVLLECQGVVALRHGKRNLVEGNLFLGNHVRNTGGVRVVDADHIIRNNTFVDLAGHRFFSPLAVMNAVPNSLPNRYVQPQNVMISNNTFSGCSQLEFGTGADSERTLAPENIHFLNNRFLNGGDLAPFNMIDRNSNVEFRGNLVEKTSKFIHEGFMSARLKPIVPPDLTTIRNGTGVSWSDPDSEKSIGSDVVTEVHVYPSDNLPQVIKTAKAGSRIFLHKGIYLNDETINIYQPMMIVGDGMNQVTLRYKGRDSESIMTISDGGFLTVKGVTFDGTLTSGASVPSAGISTADRMVRPYGLVVENCGFGNYGENGNSCIRGGKATFADSVVVRNCKFFSCAGTGINYAEERDDQGRYNVENLIIDNCSFSRFLGIPVNVYRGGSDESTAGPYVHVTRCNFYDCCNRQRGSVLRLIGPQFLEIASCNFDNSGRGGASVRLDEAIWEDIRIHDCNLWNSGKVLSIDDRVITGKIFHVQPEYVHRETLDFHPLSGSELSVLKIGLK